jgi:hypothetical protein
MASQRPFCVCGSQRRTTIERSRGRSGQLSRQLQTDRTDWLTCQSDGGNELRWPRLERRHASLVSRIMVIETKLLSLRFGSPIPQGLLTVMGSAAGRTSRRAINTSGCSNPVPTPAERWCSPQSPARHRAEPLAQGGDGHTKPID